MSNSFLGIDTVSQSQTTWAASTREPRQELDKNAFLQLLITQLQYQDPLNPMDDRDFIAQMAQFSALEQQMQLNQSFERSQAFGTIGKNINATFTCDTSGERIDIEQGLVTSVRFQGSTVYLAVATGEGKIIDVPFGSVSEISEDFFLSAQLHEIFSQVQGQRATDLMGKTVMGFTMNGETLEFVEGKVDSISVQGDKAVLHVGSIQLNFPNDIFAIADDMRLIGSTKFTHGDVLTGIEITNNNETMHLLFDNGSRIQAKLINNVVDALTFIGSTLTFGDVVNGKVVSISMQGGIPFLNAEVPGDDNLRQIDMLAYLESRAPKSE